MSVTVGIVGGSISGNKGAEAMTTAVIGGLRARLGDARFILFSPYPRADRPLEGRYAATTVADGSPLALVAKMLPATVLGCLLRTLGLRGPAMSRPMRLLRQCDVVVDVAGISFSDGRGIYLPFNVLTIWPAMAAGLPVAKMAQAMGPFRGRLNRFLARRLLGRCRVLIARGAGTLENLRSIGIDSAGLCPDVAFLLNDLPEMALPDERVARYADFGTPSRRLVGISPSSVVHRSCTRAGLDHVGIHARFIEHLLESGYRVLLVPHSARRHTAKLKNNDLPVVRRIMERLRPSAEVAAVEEELDSIALRRLTGRCDFFLAERFHGMISALAMKVPVMVCGWGHKYQEMLEPFGLPGFAMDYRAVSAEVLAETFDRLVAREGAVRAAIDAALPAVLADARKQLDAVAGLLRT